MTSKRFLIKSNQVNKYAFLYGDEHHHLSKVVRIKPKENVCLFDELGFEYIATVEEIKKDYTKLSIIERIKKNSNKVEITLVQSVLKAKNMDLVIQKATELGVSKIIPVEAQRSISKIGDENEKKNKRWKRIASEASKQCGRVHIPEIFMLSTFERVIKNNDNSLKYFLSEKKGKYFKDILMDPPDFDKKIPLFVLLVIGPEGGWTKEEEIFFRENGLEAVSLGNLILRSETATISSVALISHFWNV